MELKEYLKVFKKYFAFILLVGLTGALIAYISTKSLPRAYSLTQTFYLAALTSTPGRSEPALQSQDIYSYEGYYAQEKARNFTDTAVAILDSDDFKSDVGEDSQNLAVRKMAPQVIRLTASAPNSQSAQKLMSKTINIFNEKSVTLADSRFVLSLKPISSHVPGPSRDQIDKKIITVFGLLLGFAFATFVVSLKTYFRI